MEDKFILSPDPGGLRVGSSSGQGPHPTLTWLTAQEPLASRQLPCPPASHSCPPNSSTPLFPEAPLPPPT